MEPIGKPAAENASRSDSAAVACSGVGKYQACVPTGARTADRTNRNQCSTSSRGHGC